MRTSRAHPLNAAAEDGEPRVYLAALRTVAEAEGMAKVAKAAGVPRESLYRALPAGGNPRFSTLHAILKAAGLRLSVERADSRKSATVVRADHRPSPSRS